MTNPRLCYQTVEFGSIDIHLCTLRDKQEFHDPEGIAENLGISPSLWPLFGIIWPSSLILAHYIHDQSTDEKRILEVGCGMALTSLLLNKQHADITATDYHPEVESFLNRNTALNQDKEIPFKLVDWADEHDDLGLFDLIIGSDILYEDEHSELLANFISRHAKSNCEVVVVDPGRGRKNKLRTRMIEHGFTADFIKAENTDYLDQEYKGHILKFNR